MYLQAQRPIGTEIRFNRVVIRHRQEIDGQIAEPDNLAATGADRNDPLLPVRRGFSADRI